MRCNNKKCKAYTLHSQTNCKLIPHGPITHHICWWGFPDGAIENFPEHNSEPLMSITAFMKKHKMQSIKGTKTSDARYSRKHDIDIHRELWGYFEQHKDKISTYDEIGKFLRSLNPGGFYGIQQIRNMIPRLRKKFGIKIHNHPKQGYRLAGKDS